MFIFINKKVMAIFVRHVFKAKYMQFRGVCTPMYSHLSLAIHIGKSIWFIKMEFSVIGIPGLGFLKLSSVLV